MRFSVPVRGGALVGERQGRGDPPALVLHGGPGVSDYTAGLAAELADSFTLYRYQQRGVPPSATEGPNAVEDHVADAIAVMDAVEIERVWLVGHSWGGHLAMHIAVAHPERVLGIVAVDTLGALADGGMADFRQEMDRRFLDTYGRESDDSTELYEFWPLYFSDRGQAPPMPPIDHRPLPDTRASWEAHFAHGTLEHALPQLEVAAVFVHGRDDPLSWRVSESSAALIPGARLDVIAECGHFPWIETPGRLAAAVAGLR